MPIVWRDALSVDRGVIDEDHRHLLDLINSVEATVTADHKLGELQAEIEALVRYTRVHFSREEEMMFARQYAKFDAHKALHHQLVEQLNDVAEPIRAATATDSPASAAVDQVHLSQLTELLRHWLVDHIVKEDLKLKQILLS